MSKYKYASPESRGYTKFKLTKKQHNELFPKRKTKWTNKYEYYYNDKNIVIHKFINVKGVIVCTLSLPIIILLHGFSNIKEIIKEVKELYNQKESGSFSKDIIWNNQSKYEQVMKIVKGE